MFETPQVPAENVVALDEIKTQVKQWRTAIERTRHWKEAANEAALEIISRMRAADASVGTLGNIPTVTLTPHTHQHLDAVKLRAEHAELADEYTTRKDSWRLHVAAWLDGAA